VQHVTLIGPVTLQVKQGSLDIIYVNAFDTSLFTNANVPNETMQVNLLESVTHASPS